MGLAQMYGDTRRRLAELLRSLPPDDLEVVVPATPAWTVADVARHLAGVCDDVLAGRIEGAATDPWTARQVEARKGVPVEDVLAEWDEKAPQVESLVDAVGPAAHPLVIDLVTHEQDVRAALGRPGARDTEAAHWARHQLVAAVDAAIRQRSLPPLRVVSGDDEYLLGGDGDPAATLEAEPYELLRALIGRRSVAQLRAMGWTGDPEPYLPALSLFPPAADDLVE